MTDDSWHSEGVRALKVRLAGDAIGEVDEAGDPICDDTFLLLLNADHDEVDFNLPPCAAGQHWECVADTAHADWRQGWAVRAAHYRAASHAFVVLRLARG